MGIEKIAAKYFKMSDAVWERHANPWSVWTRFPCLPLLALAVWSRVWIGWLSLLPIAVVCIWIWLNPRAFNKPRSTDHWASKAVLGERVFLEHARSDLPYHHLRAIRMLNLITSAGFLMSIYGLVVLDAASAIVGTALTILGKSWFLDRMVWLYQDMSVENERYRSWLY